MDLATRISCLSPTKRALLELAVENYLKSHLVKSSSTIQHHLHCDIAPLSFSQQRLWFLDQLHPGKADYNLPQVLYLDGPLNILALRNALNSIIARHAALRTTFIKQGSELQQHVATELVLKLPVIDLSHCNNVTTELQQQITEEISHIFDLSTGPLLRAKIFLIKPEYHALVVTMHHIVSDGWSMDIFNRELGDFYNGFCKNLPTSLTDLPIQYQDYAIWQRAQTEDLTQQLTFWKQKLSGAPPILELPTDKLRPPVQSFSGNNYRIDLSPWLSDKLRNLAQQENVSLFMLLLAAYQALLYRYTAQDDIIIGVPFAGRVRPELESLIGFFVNSLVIRAHYSPELCFRHMLTQTRETVLDAFNHQELPFEKLVEELAPQRDLSRNPVFQVMFSFQDNSHVLPQMEDLAISNPDLISGTAKFDLTLFITESEQGFQATFNYATDLFYPDTIARMAGHYLTLLTAIIRNPDQAINHLPILTAAEEAQLAQWNNTQTDFPIEFNIPQQFELQVLATPDMIAVSAGGKEINYRNLNIQANQLAHYLQRQCVTRGSLIGLCLERSLDAVVAMLAILKAGGTYVPLDPSYPKERLALMIEDSQLIALISNSVLAQSLPSHSATLICLDSDWPTIATEPDINPIASSNGHSLAYVIYTSGSTGIPKGVCVTHRAVNRLVINTNYVSLNHHDVIAHAANIAFDAATFEIWGALLNGGRMLIVPRDVLLSPSEFGELLRTQGVTTLFLTTALFNQMIHHNPQAFAHLKQLLFGGEACDPNHVRACLAAVPPQRLIHVYGPTETTTFATWHEVHDVPPNARTVPIGRPIANTTCHIVDAHLQPVPVGVVGELYIGGPGVAQGYLNRPTLTAEKFIASPFTVGDCLYRTGDLVRYRNDGAIEFVGRIDHQVKLRGFRIELGEIDEVLKQHPALRDCLTVLREDTPGNKCLVAYVTAQPQQLLSDQALRQHLKSRLPDYMIPATFVILSTLPLTANGKINRAALPAPCPSLTTSISVRPRNSIEFHLVKIWEDVLGRGPVGIDDNFFELGGHSLLAVKLFDQIQKHFGKQLPLDTLWSEGATIKTLAGILERERDSILWPELVQIKAGGDMSPLFCIHTMGGNLFHYYDLARALSPQLPVYGLQARGVYGKQTPRDNVTDIAADCINAMRQRQPHGPYRIAGFSSGGIVAFEMAQQLHASGETVSSLALLDCYAPGVSHKGKLWSQLDKLFTLKGLRQLQELVYHRILYPLGLRNLRQMRSIGEFHRWAHWSYTPKPYSGKIDLFIAIESEQEATDPLLGWSKVAKGELMIHSAPGNHGLMTKSPNVEILAAKLQQILDMDSQ